MMKEKKVKFLFAAAFALTAFFGGCGISLAAGVDIQSLQKKIGENFHYAIDKDTQKITFLSSQSGGISIDTRKIRTLSPQRVARRFLKEYGAYFGIRNHRKNLRMMEQKKEESGMIHIRYAQLHKGIKVFGKEIAVHLNGDLSVSSANGGLVNGVEVNIHPKISRSEAAKIARELWDGEFGSGNPELREIELLILNENVFRSGGSGRDYLVWKVDLADSGKFRHRIYFIDARNGELVYQRTGAISFSGTK